MPPAVREANGNPVRRMSNFWCSLMGSTAGGFFYD